MPPRTATREPTTERHRIGFLVGARAAGTMVGEFPGLQRGLDTDGNLSATSDFRGVYSALLEIADQLAW